MFSLFFHRLLSPPYCYRFLGRLLPACLFLTFILLIYGLVGGLYFAPADYQQGDGFRIIYVHVPSAFLSLIIYAMMSVAALLALVWRIKLADFFVIAATPLGAAFTFLALITGSLWGKPMWGTWWIWDARLTSELILLFIYLAIIALHSALSGKRGQNALQNIFVLIGALNLPIIHYSVYWWNTLHQGSTLMLTGPSHIVPSMLYPLLAMIGAFLGVFSVSCILRLQNQLLWEGRKSQWVKTLRESKK